MTTARHEPGRERPGDPPSGTAVLVVEDVAPIRLLLTQEHVSFQGEFFTVDGAHIGPLPAKPLDIWLGGSAPGASARASTRSE